jgi:hypothetical protein
MARRSTDRKVTGEMLQSTLKSAGGTRGVPRSFLMASITPT